MKHIDMAVHFKRILSILVLAFFTTSGYSQMIFKDLEDLTTLCKKEDFESVKIFFTNQGYELKSFKTNYDHGSYFVLAEIEARKKIGVCDYSIENEFNNIYDEITIKFNEKNDSKELKISQVIRCIKNNFIIENVRGYLISQIVNGICNYTWSSASITNRGLSDLLEAGSIDALGWGSIDLDTSSKVINRINCNSFKNTFSKIDFKNIATSSFFVSLLNYDLKNGDEKDFKIYYDIKEDYYDKKIVSQNYRLDMYTTMYKNKVTSASSNNTVDKIVIPLIQKGKSYYLKVKFGKLIKTYLLDSGASDVSIDNETLEYLEKSDKLKLENRMTDARYQLADGTIVKFKRVQIPSLEIGDIVVNNVVANIIQNGKPLLLGKSFLDSFKSWKIDNQKSSLILEPF